MRKDGGAVAARLAHVERALVLLLQLLHVGDLQADDLEGGFVNLTCAIDQDLHSRDSPWAITKQLQRKENKPG